MITGEVLEVKDVESYTYLRLKTKDGETWAAVGTAPVKVGARIRGVGEIVSVEEVKGAIQSVVRVTVEIEGSDRPACIADTVSRYFPE